MKILITCAIVILLNACAREKSDARPLEQPSPTAVQTASADTRETQTAESTSAMPQAAVEPKSGPSSDDPQPGTWSGQIKTAQRVSVLNYVGEESGDWAPIRFRNDSEAGKKILMVCANDDMCEISGAIEWLDELPPPNASAVGQIVRVDSVRRLPPTRP